MSFRNNYTLTSLSGLDNISPETVDFLRIDSNPLLSECEVQSICDYLAIPGNTTEIYDNAPGCNSQQEVEAACDTVSDFNEN